MRTLPILFNTEMVKAILAGRKTVTRRLIKHNTEAVLNSPFHKENPDVPDRQIIEKLCLPPYQPGDVLYVRETWTNDKLIFGKNVVSNYHYKADGNMQVFDVMGREVAYKWKPSLHMPKEAARIFLKVKEVRVERLQEMNLDAFLDEGITIPPRAFNDPENAYGQAKDIFSALWNSTVKKSELGMYGWDANPWVWAIELEMCEKPEDM